jgi:murein DD-endopeptidase MepM/ murein hydrolase activator NlpD
MRKWLVPGRFGPVVIAGVAALLFFGAATPALADDPPTPPRAVPAPRGLPATPSGASYEKLINFANDSARDLSALQQQARDVDAARNETIGQLITLATLTERPGKVRDRLEREAIRLSASDETRSASTLSPAVREATEQMRTLRTELKEEYVALQADAIALAPYAAMPPANGAWMAPVLGELTQGFGQTTYWGEPARVYGGVYYSHFHDGLDIATSMYSPVVAAAPGRVVWVGHLPDGAMVVIIAHIGGLVSLYAHLDDRIAPPRVAAGDQVQEGQIIGAIGMTGMTTGPHVHFVVWRNGELIDPLTLTAR